jgi:hypothetical protein
VDSTDESSRQSRRTLLKGAGLGVASAWAVPGVFSATAEAAVNNTICLRRAVAEDRAACGVCSTLPPCDPGGNCFCFVTTKDCCFCVAPRACSAAEPCTKDRQCPPGFKCVHSCCDNAGFGPLCGMPCGDPGRPSRASLKGQMTQAGQL